MFAIKRAAQRTARRSLRTLLGECAGLLAKLYEIEDPAARAATLADLAKAERRAATIHARAYPDDVRAGAEDLEAAAALVRLVAASEEAVSRSEWTTGVALGAGSRFLVEFAEVEVIHACRNEMAPHLVHVIFSNGETLAVGAGDTVRTAGPDDYPVMVEAAAGGAGLDEVREWYHLATTRDRDHRAELLTRLAELAGARLGERPAGVLLRIADSEVHHACAGAAGVRGEREGWTR